MNFENDPSSAVKYARSSKHPGSVGVSGGRASALLAPAAARAAAFFAAWATLPPPRAAK